MILDMDLNKAMDLAKEHSLTIVMLSQSCKCHATEQLVSSKRVMGLRSSRCCCDDASSFQNPWGLLIRRDLGLLLQLQSGI